MEEKKEGQIHRLDSTTIDQIAAGEVIENCASVIKELVENAIDAKATRIIIETTGGGQGLIVVKDNGEGIAKEELPLAIERHTTSKIVRASDLFSLSTLGFRGEALSAIAAVSKMKIHSKPSHQEGACLQVSGGKDIKILDLPRREGTTVEVASLFYNLPARKKFQKSPQSESVEIGKVLIPLALCHPEISFTWISEGETQWEVRAGQERITPLLGAEFGLHAEEIIFEQGGYACQGHLVKASCHRPNKTGQYLFVNGRPVTSPFVASVIQEGYGTRLPANRFPLFLLSLKCPPDVIDVNIHPRKKEIRFLDEKKVREALLKMVKKGLEETIVTMTPTRLSFPAPSAFSLNVMPPSEKREEPPPPQKCVVSVLSLFGPYVLVQGEEEEILAVDIGRAYGRIYFERLTEKEEEPATQHLLFPLTQEKSVAEMKKLEFHLPLLQKLGILVRPFGKTGCAIDAYPEIFSEKELLTLLDTLLEELPQVEAGQNKRKATLHFCRAIRKRLATLEEGAKLVEELFRCREPHLCPEGRSTFLRITPKEIAKWI